MSEGMQSQLQSITVVDLIDGASFGFDDSEEGLDDGGFACACPSNDAHLLPLLDAEGDLLQHQRQLGPISEGEVLDSDARPPRPFPFAFAADDALDGGLAVLVVDEFADFIPPVVAIPQFLLG